MLFQGPIESRTSFSLRKQLTSFCKQQAACLRRGERSIVGRAGLILPPAPGDDQSAECEWDQPFARIHVAKSPRPTLQHVLQCGAENVAKIQHVPVFPDYPVPQFCGRVYRPSTGWTHGRTMRKRSLSAPQQPTALNLRSEPIEPVFAVERGLSRARGKEVVGTSQHLSRYGRIRVRLLPSPLAGEGPGMRGQTSLDSEKHPLPEPHVKSAAQLPQVSSN